MELRGIDWAALLQIVFLFLFSLFSTIGAIFTTRRLARYLRQSEVVPLILWRDVIARNSLALPFVAIFVMRAMRELGADVSFTADWPWIVFTGAPAVFGAAVYAYFELFVIERHGGAHEPGDYPGNGNGNGNGSASP